MVVEIIVVWSGGLTILIVEVIIVWSGRLTVLIVVLIVEVIVIRRS